MTTSNILAQIQGRKVRNDLDQILASWAEEKKDTVKEFSEDVLVISCCIQRMAHNEPVTARFSRSLSSPSVIENITDLDRKKAENIRKYYNHKLLTLTLQGRELTKFRKDLQKFLISDPTKILESLCGIVYKLPYFYDYDRSVDEIFKSVYFKNSKLSNMHENTPRSLNFVKKIENQRKHSNNIEYWFEDEQLNKVMFSIATNNPLLELLDRHINDDKLNVVARYYLRKKDLNEYFVMENWSFV
jgi:hypothetical protein